MSLLEKIKGIPIINGHTHISGVDVPQYKEAGKIVSSKVILSSLCLVTLKGVL